MKKIKRIVLCAIYMLSAVGALATDVWAPQTPTGPVTNQLRPLVLYGDEWSRHFAAGHAGSANRWRDNYNPYYGDAPQNQRKDYPFDFYDADGDGNTNDGYIVSLEFSETNRLGMGEWPHCGIYPTPINWRFYGGASWNVSDSEFANGGYCLEQGMNADHNGLFPTSAEDHPLHGQPYSGSPDSKIKMYWSIVWNKDDFLNGASNGVVSLGEDSRFTIHVHRYWVGYNVVRCIIKDSGQYYCHQKEFEFEETGGYPYLFVLDPTNTLWAPYNPSGYDLRFETNQTYSAHTFTNIEAVGFYIAKDADNAGMAHTKWYNFSMKGYVEGPSRPSEHMDMKEVSGAGGVQDFYMSSCEVPYKLWREVYRFANSPQYPMEGRYSFVKDGDMGSMQYGANSHNNQEPAVNFTVHDLANWCNALSEKEGLTPCFYSDPGFSVIFKNTNIITRGVTTYNTRNEKNPDYVPTTISELYVKWDADGYRIPTPAEWELAYTSGNQSTDDSVAWKSNNSDGKTHDVGTKTANSLGLYDMVGNVWEFAWIHGDVYVPGVSNSHLAVGGSFQYSSDSRTATNSASPFGDTPFTGRHDIGLRLVRRNSGLSAPAVGSVPSGDNAYETTGIYKWKFSDSYKTAAGTPPPTNGTIELVSIPSNTYSRAGDGESIQIHPFEMGKFEVTYSQWLKVYFWGLDNGYEFDWNGNMGSMVWFDYEHTADEPVTGVTWHDILVWCNALSRMEGLDPVYCTDDTRTNEYTKAYKMRGDKLDLQVRVDGTGPEGGATEPFLFANWANNGYRLPTKAEFECAQRGGKDENYMWGDDPDLYTNYVWAIKNSGGTTHPVGQLQSNYFGLYDLMGNVAEVSWSTARQTNPDRPESQDLNNPKCGRYATWGFDASVAGGGNPMARGQSFFWSQTLGLNNTDDESNNMYMGDDAGDVGFRVVKCESNVHPIDGKEELVVKVLMTYNTNDFTDLQGRCSQGNVYRNGQYNQNGVASNAVVKWTFNLTGEIKSSPVVVDDVVYVGGGDGFYAIDSVSGAQLWKVSIPEGVESSACIVDGCVYFGANDEKMYAVYTNGTIKWSVWSDQSGTVHLRKPIRSPVAVMYDTVFALCGNRQMGYSTATGSNVWESTANQYETTAIAMNPDYLFRGAPGAGGAGKVSLKYGVGTYGVPGAGSYCRNSAVVDGDMFYQAFPGGNFIGGDNQYSAYKAVVISNVTYKYNKYFDDHLPADERTGCFSQPAKWNDRLIVGMDSGWLYSYALEDGECNTNYFKSSGAIRSPITVSTLDDTIYFGSWDDNVYGVDGETGAKRWEIKTGGNVESGACVYDEKIYIGCDDGFLYCIEESSALAIVATPSTFSVTENTTNSFFVRLSQQPSGSVTVAVSKASGDTDVTVIGDPVTLTFSTSDWDTYQEVFIAAADDTDSDNGTATLHCSAEGLTTQNVTVNEVDDDQKIVISTSVLTVNEGDTATFNVRLNADVGLPLTVTVAHNSGDADLSVKSGSSLDFTSENYDDWQTVTLEAAQDADMTEGSAVVRCSAPGLDDVDLTATEHDDDIPRVMVDLDGVTVIEGSNQTFNIWLNIDPEQTVTVNVARVSGDADISVDAPTQFIFTTNNFSTEQTVTLVAAPDSDTEDSSATIRCSSPNLSDDTDITATELDSTIQLQSASFQDGVSPDASYAGTRDAMLDSYKETTCYSNNTSVMIGRGNLHKPVVQWAVDSVPSNAVLRQAILEFNCTLSIDDPMAVNLYAPKRAWTETGVTWDNYNETTAWQTAGATGSEDIGSTVLGSFSIKSAANVEVELNSNGLAYAQTWLTSASNNCGFLLFEQNGEYGQVRMRENETLSARPKLTLRYTVPSVVATPVNPSVPEGSTAEFTVKLSQQPDATTTVSVSRTSGDTDITVQSGSSLTFTVTNWEAPQTVTLAAAEDSDWIDSSAEFTCATLLVFSDAIVTATESDNEVDQTYILPWSETFETNPVHMAGTLGALDGQHGWTATATTVTNTNPQAGSQACEVGEDGQISHLFTNNATQVNLTLWMKPTVGEISAPIPADAATVFYVNTNDQVVAYNSTNATVIASPTVSNDWNKIEVSCDFISKVWKLSLNGTELFTNFAFYADTQSDFNELRIVNEEGTAVVDSIALTEADSFDQDDDGIADSWEIEHYGSTNVAPNAMASNGVNTVLQAYIADLNPTNAASRFLISDLSPLTSESVITWNGVSGRVYSVYWSSNLLDGFVLLSNNVPWTGSVFTDETHNAESKGFYKIEVELE